MQLVDKPIDWHIRLDSLGYRKSEEHASVDVAALVDRLLAVAKQRRVPPALSAAAQEIPIPSPAT